MAPTLPPPPAPPVEEEIPKRFQASRNTLLLDRFMTSFIGLGGVLVITAVFGIFIFILSQIVPLFRDAEVEEISSFPLENKDYKMIGVDEWSALPFVVEPNGALSFIDLKGQRGMQLADVGFQEKREITAVTYRPYGQRLIYGTADGRFSVVNVNYSMAFENGQQQVVHAAKAEPFHPIGPDGGRVTAIGYGDAGAVKLAAAIVQVEGKPQLHTAMLTQKRTLLGSGNTEVGATVDLTPLVPGEPLSVLVNGYADGILVTTKTGEILYFFRQGDEIALRQTFKPFGDLADPSIAAINFILGDASFVATNQSGDNRVFSLYVPKGGDQRLWGQTKQFPKLPGAPNFFSSSLRNKSFLIGGGDFASLRYSTTEAVRWEERLPFQVQHAVLSGKQDRILFLDREHRFHVYRVHDPHPEASIKGLFGKLWYEGSSEPKYEWQSTGGTDDFEPKLSLVPLIIGTLKGTLYAMLFALPIAILAAIYSSQFLDPKAKRVVKPVMEIMASLPSVVLGFPRSALARAFARAPGALGADDGRADSARRLGLRIFLVRPFVSHAALDSPRPRAARFPPDPGRRGLCIVATRTIRGAVAFHGYGSFDGCEGGGLPPMVARRYGRGLPAAQLTRRRLHHGFRGDPNHLHHHRRRALECASRAHHRFARARREPLADRAACGASDGVRGDIFGHHDRAGPRDRRDDDRRDGYRKYADHGSEYLLGHAHALGEYRGGAAGGAASRHALPDALPRCDGAFPHDLRGEYRRRADASAAPRQVQDHLSDARSGNDQSDRGADERRALRLDLLHGPGGRPAHGRLSPLADRLARRRRLLA
jgi:phosphate transport system permease protein